MRAIILALLLAAGSQSGHELFQKALVKERAEGNMEEAIQLYQRIVKEHAADKALAAKALLQMGQCYEKLGKAEARKAYERIVREYADEREPATQARARLAALDQPSKTHGGTAMATRRLWAGPEVDLLGSVSPDGRYASFVDWDTGDLAIKDLVSGEKRRLTNKGAWWDSDEFALYSKFSPDGKQIAYSWFNKNNLWDLRVIAASAGVEAAKPRVVYRNDEIEYLQPGDWSRDGRLIATILTRKDRTNQLAMVSVADGSARVIKSLEWRYPSCVGLSPDGRYLAYDFPEREDAPERDINVLETDGSREVPLIQHPALDGCPIWTPDGKGILFGSDRTGTMGGWLVRVADGKPSGAPVQVMKEGLVLANQPMGLTPGGALYYGFQASTRDVYIATVDLEAGKVVAAPTAASRRFVGFNGSPEWSPDGRQLVYQSRRPPHNTVTLRIRSLDGGEERELHPKLRYLNRPRWSPDRRHLLGRGNDFKGRPGLYRVDMQTGEVSLIVGEDGGGFIRQPEWGAGGKVAVFVRGNDQEKVSRIVVRDLESGQEREICRTTDAARSHINHLAVSPDGLQVAFLAAVHDDRSTALSVVPVAGGEPRVLYKLQEKEGAQNVAWTPDGGRLLLTRSRETVPTKPEFWLVPASGGQARKLDLGLERVQGLRIHPDGRRIAFQAGESSAELWVMENFLPVERASR